VPGVVALAAVCDGEAVTESRAHDPWQGPD
jgi:hypothetical protein